MSHNGVESTALQKVDIFGNALKAQNFSYDLKCNQDAKLQ